MMSSITFIPFTDWYDGLSRTIKKLRSINAPMPLADKGGQAVLDALAPHNVLLEMPEKLYANCFRFARIPDTIRIFSPKSFSGSVPESISVLWPNHQTDERHTAAFTAPPEIHGFALDERERVSWRTTAALGTVPTRHIVSNLLRQSLRLKMLQRGMREDKTSGLIFFPRQSGDEETKLTFAPPAGRPESLQATGGRKFGPMLSLLPSPDVSDPQRHGRRLLGATHDAGFHHGQGGDGARPTQCVRSAQAPDHQLVQPISGSRDNSLL